jgi:hypothetical protein
VSRYYTNVEIPEQFDQRDSFIEQIELLKFEKTRLIKKNEYLYSVLENIPNAIIEYGHVDLRFDNGKKTLKIGQVP